MPKKINPSINHWQDKEWLEVQYFDNKLSFNKIGKLCGKSAKNIQYFFKKYGLVARPSFILHPWLNRGDSNPNWKGGRVLDCHGYVRIYHPKTHDYKGKGQKYVLEHVLIMEKILGRALKHPEIVHHINGVIDDNRPENLQIFSCPKQHNTYEQYLCLFAKKTIFGELSPNLKPELQSLFQSFLSSIVNER